MHAGSQDDRGSPRSKTLGRNDPQAAILSLSPVKRGALVACVEADGALYKRYGAWSTHATGPLGRKISGNTVADLIRDGMLTLNVIGKDATARLTPQGERIARGTL
jgi:hypothetical protein